MKTLNQNKLSEFLRKAKTATYASGNKPIYMPDGKKTYTFKQDDFWYQDTYYANLIDAGQEIVWYKNTPIWVMSYHGGLHKNDTDSKDCFEFLNQVLMNLPTQFPIRGPKYFCNQEWEYNNIFTGDLMSFVGNENIEKNNVEIYSKNYIGGIIRHREKLIKNFEVFTQKKIYSR